MGLKDWYEDEHGNSVLLVREHGKYLGWLLFDKPQLNFKFGSIKSYLEIFYLLLSLKELIIIYQLI